MHFWWSLSISWTKLWFVCITNASFSFPNDAKINIGLSLNIALVFPTWVQVEHNDWSTSFRSSLPFGVLCGTLNPLEVPVGGLSVRSADRWSVIPTRNLLPASSVEFWIRFGFWFWFWMWLWLWLWCWLHSIRCRGSFALRHFTFPPNVNKNVQSQLLGRWLPVEAAASVHSYSDRAPNRWHATLWQNTAKGGEARSVDWVAPAIRRNELDEMPTGWEGVSWMPALFMWIFRLRRASSWFRLQLALALALALAVAAVVWACLTSSSIAVDIVPEFQFDVHGAAAPVYHKSCSSNCLDSPGAFRMGLDWIGLDWMRLACLSSCTGVGIWELQVAAIVYSAP